MKRTQGEIPTASLLHVSDNLFERVKGAPLHFFLCTIQIRRLRGNPLDRAKYAQLKALREGKTVLEVSAGLPVLNINCATGVAILSEGNHRVESFYEAGYAWIPIRVYVVGEPYQRSEKNYKKFGQGPRADEWIKVLMNTPAHAVKQLWIQQISRLLYEFCDIEVLDYSREYDTFSIQKEERFELPFNYYYMPRVLPDTPPPSSSEDDDSVSCAYCETVAKFKCAQCQKSIYCGSKCALLHWRSGHKVGCIN